MLPPSSWLKNKLSKIPIRKQVLLATSLRAVMLLVLFFDPEYEGDIYLRNVG
jgi:hypothetical protein